VRASFKHKEDEGIFELITSWIWSKT